MRPGRHAEDLKGEVEGARVLDADLRKRQYQLGGERLIEAIGAAVAADFFPIDPDVMDVMLPEPVADAGGVIGVQDFEEGVAVEDRVVLYRSEEGPGGCISH